ncbi:hypothetical protein [Methylobacterium sp. 22177]|uniref:hypothetical protein n=1 Tax=Methylobacterium sp. 22177 TaxID=3453885 RepID=UPI003F86DD30
MSAPDLPPFDWREIVRPGEVVFGTRHLDADALDRPTGLALANLPPGPLAAFVVAHGAIRWALDGELATPDHFGTLAPAGSALDVFDAHGLRIVAVEPGATATVTLKRGARSE